MDFWTSIAVILIFFVGALTVFTWVWTKKVAQRSLGYVAEICPACGTACSVRVDRTEIQTRILYVPLGRARLFAFSGECKQCSDELPIQPTDYAAFEADGKIPLELLISGTNPKLDPGNKAASAAFERFAKVREPFLQANQVLDDRYAEGKGIDYPTAVAFLMAFVATCSIISFDQSTVFFYVAIAAVVPLLWYGQALADRCGGGRQIDTSAGIAFLLAFLVPAGVAALVPAVPPWADGALLIAGLLASCAVLFGEPQRFFQRQLRGKLSIALKRVDPRPAELDACLQALSKYEYRICKFVTARGLVQDLSEMPVPPIEAAAAPAVSAALPVLDERPRGRCPNCAAEIALDSIECPNSHCKALFGPHSAWKILPA